MHVATIRYIRQHKISEHFTMFKNHNKEGGHHSYALIYFVFQNCQYPPPFKTFNPLTPKDDYSGRTAPLNSKRYIYIFIQQIQVLNILKMVYTLCTFLLKMQFVS